MIEGVIGVTIWTADLDHLLPFYRDTLDLQLHSVQRDFVAFEWDGMRLNIGRHSEVEGRSREPYRIMVNLGVTDIHGVYEKLSAGGVEFLRPPEREHWGGWVSTFLDPDGNTLQLLQQP